MGTSDVITFIPPTLFTIVAIAFLILWRLKVIDSWHWAAGFAQTALGFVLSTFSVQPMFDAFSSGMVFIGAAYCYGSGLLSHFGASRLRRARLWLVGIYTPILAYLVFIEQSLVWQLFLTDSIFAVLLGLAVLAVVRRASRPVDFALVASSLVVVLDSVARTIFFTFFTDSSDDLSDFATSAYNLAVHVSTVTICMIFPFTALGAIASAAIERHREDAERDHLTGLLNRRGFEKAVERHFGDRPLEGSVVVFDIDHFKAVNDRYGHAFGDKVIIALAEILKAGAEPRGFVARAGGEEFVAFLPGSGPQDARAFAELVRIALRNRNWVDPNRVTTVSAGVSQISGGDRTLERSLLRADDALYAAKSAGRDRVSIANMDVPEATGLAVVPPEGMKANSAAATVLRNSA